VFNSQGDCLGTAATLCAEYGPNGWMDGHCAFLGGLHHFEIPILTDKMISIGVNEYGSETAVKFAHNRSWVLQILKVSLCAGNKANYYSHYHEKGTVNHSV